MFEKITGHDFQKKIFSETGALRSSYIFEGPTGIGKYTMAKELAIFHSGGILQNQHIINKESISVDDVRSVCEEVQRFPYMNKKRIVIINDAEKMNEVSQNTLLKTLENPPNDCHFFLVCSDSKLLLDTIVSRCIVCKFDLIQFEVINELIKEACIINDPVFMNFVSVCIRGCVGRAYELIESKDMVYYNMIYDLINKLESNSSNKFVYPISQMFSVDNNTKLLREMIDISYWFSYKYFNSRDDRYLTYSKICDDIMLNVFGGGSPVLCAELLVIRILKHNGSLKKRK